MITIAGGKPVPESVLRGHKLRALMVHYPRMDGGAAAGAHYAARPDGRCSSARACPPTIPQPQSASQRCTTCVPSPALACALGCSPRASRRTRLHHQTVPMSLLCQAVCAKPAAFNAERFRVNAAVKQEAQQQLGISDPVRSPSALRCCVVAAQLTHLYACRMRRSRSRCCARACSPAATGQL